MAKQPAQKGRPRKKAPKPGERVSLGLRVTAEMKAALDEAAARSGRSQSQEAEFRIERSFYDQQILYDALELAYGSSVAGMMLVLGDVMRLVMRHGDILRAPWDERSETFDQAVAGINAILTALRPGPTTTPLSEIQLEGIKGMGVAYANGHLDLLDRAERTLPREYERRLAIERDLLGNAVTARLKSPEARATRENSTEREAWTVLPNHRE
jgi:TraY domain